MFIGGRDVRTYRADELHRLFGVVFQNDVIFADTIRENIIFGRDMEDDAVNTALRDAMALEFVDAYDDGTEHRAVIHGANFSGGQKQRLLVARALAANADILVLDDSSSALDYKTDAMLRRAIRENHSSATTIVVAQRISSIMSLDRIIVLDEGRISDIGTHDELMQRSEIYREVYHSQQKGGDD